MAASTIFFNGRLTSVPGAYTEVDASGLANQGLTASGIVALVGTAVGGKPYSAVSESNVKAELQTATNPQKPFEYFRSGDLKEAAAITFDPALDPDIAGAQEVVFVKVNNATQSEATLSNASGDAVKLTSKDYGYFTTQINAEIGAGTSKGVLITLAFEDIEEVFDDVGGDDVFTVTFAAPTPSAGYTTLTATVDAASIYSSFTLARAGLSTDLPAQVSAGHAVEVLSSSAADTMDVTVYGTDASDAAQSETITLSGTTTVAGTKTWNSIHGVRVGTAPAGTVTVRNLSAGSTIATLTSSATSKGLSVLSAVAVAGEEIAFVRSAAGTERLTVVGLNASGASQVETVRLSGTSSVSTVGKWSLVYYLALGEVSTAGTVTASAKSVYAPNAGLDTLQKVADKFNATTGYTFALATGETSRLASTLDYASATNILSPAVPGFSGDLNAVVVKINNESNLVEAERVSGGTGAPSVTSSPVFLAGGHEGNSTPGQEGVPYATNADWQSGFDLLKKIRVNTIVPLSHAPAIHAMVSKHCKYMGGAGHSERDFKVGVLNTALTGLATKTEIESQIVALNTKYGAVFAQQIERYNTLGEKEVMNPMFGAAMLAGMQAGSGVGEPITRKWINSLSLDQDSSWNPTDDAEELIQAGLCFAETVDGRGRRIVRGVTTYLTSSNMAYTEQSVVEATSYAVYNYRTAMETVVGRRGFAGTVQAAHGEAIGILGLLVGVALVAYRALTTDLILDVLEQSVEIAPVLPVNFVRSTVHLVTVPQSAS